jgi:hypothetical protein
LKTSEVVVCNLKPIAMDMLVCEVEQPLGISRIAYSSVYS